MIYTFRYKTFSVLILGIGPSVSSRFGVILDSRIPQRHPILLQTHSQMTSRYLGGFLSSPNAIFAHGLTENVQNGGNARLLLQWLFDNPWRVPKCVECDWQ